MRWSTKNQQGWDSSWVLTAGLLLDRKGQPGGGAKGKKKGEGGRRWRVALFQFPGHRLPFRSRGLALL